MVRRSLFIGIILVGSLAVPAGGSPTSTPERRSSDERREPDGLTRAFRAGEIDRGRYLLDRADSLFRLSSVRSRFGTVRRPDPHQATLLLRDLAQNMSRLDGSEKEEAERILARPTDGASDPQRHGYSAPPGDFEETCKEKTNTNTGQSMDLCVHWVTSTADAPPLADTGTNGVPDYIDTEVIPTFDQVWEREVNELGYRSPKKDGASGPNSGLDIYLANLGEDGIYGYCTNDDPKKSSLSLSAYCVIDNDFAQSDFAPNVYGTDALQVTAAHEFFHAVQFAYDWLERKFFMEGTAVWIEDEVFDDVNANYDYLHDSALHQPEVPLDAGDSRPDENFEYGSWLFWRFLAERYSGAKMIKSMWEKASTSSVFDSLRQVLNGRNSNLGDAYADFALWNRTIDTYNFGLRDYEEGIDYMEAVSYRYPPWDAEFWLGPSRPSSGIRKLRLNHLSMRYVMIQGFNDNLDGTKLKAEIDAKTTPGARAHLMIFSTYYDDVEGDYYDNNYCVKAHRIPLTKNGVGSTSKPFWPGTCKGRPADYSWAWLTLVNGGFKDDASFTYRLRTIQ